LVLQPDRFNVVAASNLSGDILAVLGPACFRNVRWLDTPRVFECFTDRHP
jgi:hypothetical protein